MTIERKRIVVTGRRGQLVSSLQACAIGESLFDVVSVGRPDLDLAVTNGIRQILLDAKPDVIVSAAAYTAVDLAESNDEVADAINETAATQIAAVARDLAVPLIHLSTDYVFDGRKNEPYRESDPPAPLGVYGRSKLAGERGVAKTTDNHVILRTAWIYGPYGKNFLRTMLRLAETSDCISVVDDQIGNPTSSLDLARAVLMIASNLLSSDAREYRGLFHAAGEGEASWADLAEEIFVRSAVVGFPSASVKRISSADYPTTANRPSNSRLDCSKLHRVHGLKLPHWKPAVAHAISKMHGQEKQRQILK